MRGFVRTKRPVDFWRERRACKGLIAADFGTRERISGFVAAKSMDRECGGRTKVGDVGFNLLTQLTEITTCLFIFDKQ